MKAEDSQIEETTLMGDPTRDDEWRRRYEAVYRDISEGLDRMLEQFDELLLLSSIGKECKPLDSSGYEPRLN